MLYRISLAVILFLGFLIHGSCQNQTLPQITPHSPNAAAFDKYVDVPVSLSSGRINLSIPIYEINVGPVKIPIALVYNNNGLMPDEIPTWVGHGWSLSTGGVITYHQRGLNDFDPTKGMFALGKAEVDSFLNNDMDSFQKQTFFENIIAGNVDAEYDTYNYNFPGGSGSFYFVSDTEARLNPKADVQVAKTDSGFKITDDRGNNFFFEKEEFSSTVNSADISPDFSDNSSFYLSKIVANNGSVATFKYKSYEFQYTKTNETIFHMTSRPDPDCPSSNINTNDALTTIYYLLPDSLIFPEGYIKFNLSTSYRDDLNYIDSGCNIPYLQSMSIYNYLGQKIKDFNFYDSYFGTNGRLRLDSLSESNSSTIGRKWKFSYYGQTSTLGIFGHAKDHWGYANTNTANTTIPTADYNSFISNWTTYDVEYADLTSDFNSAENGLIKTITYPTGGSTQFEYEPNQFKLSKYTDFDFGEFLQIPTTYFTNNIISRSEITGGTDTGSFTVSEDGYYMISSYKELSPDPFYDNADVTFTGPSSATLYSATNQCGTSSCTAYEKIVFLSAGSYTFTVKGSFYVSGGNTIYLAANLYLNSPVSPVYYQVGGCRISKVTHTDSIANSTIVRRYIYDDTLPNVSFKQVPYYVTTVTQDYLIPPNGCLSCGPSYTVHDESVIPFAGNVIEYGTVTELEDSAGTQGKTVNHYLLSENIAGSDTDPYTPSINTSWRTGSILEKDLYLSSDSLVAKKQNTDSYDYEGTQINGVKVSYSTYCEASTGRYYNTNLSTLFSESFRKAQGGNTLYSGSDSLSQTDSLYYNLTKHNQSTGFKKDNSDGSITQKKIIFVFDYDSLSSASSADADALKQLKDKYINAPIEEVNIKQIGGTQYVIGGLLRFYKVDTAAVDRVYTLKVSSPIDISEFTFSHVNSSGTFVYDSRYEPRTYFESYDTSLNILQDRLANNQEVSYIWDYKSLYPVAEIMNAASNSVAYTSFESDGKGGWTFSGADAPDPASPTGENCYHLTGGNITKSGLPSNIYIVSYWGKSGNASVNSGSPTRTGRSVGDWTYYEHEVTGTSITIDGSVYIDELRLYPKGAMMTTYAYTPLVGMTSQCDPNNRITYYQYDQLNRLSLVRDQDYNILKKICYNYAGQPEDCGILYYNVEKTESFTRNNCGTGYTGGSVIDTVYDSTYSSSISQSYVDSLAQAYLDANGQSYANSHGTCTYVCDGSNCSGANKKCISNVCETGVKVYTDTYYDSGLHKWVCTYHYEWSDDSWSSNYIEYSNFACPV